MMRRQAITVITDQHNATLSLLDFLSRRFTYFSEKQWGEQITRARVLLNQQPASPETRLRPGDVVAFVCHDLPEPSVALSYLTIYEDRDLLVVNKPATLPCHPRGRYFNHTLWALLKNDRKGSYFSFVNRIDRETSGIVLIAKNKNAARNCQQQFSSQQVEKQYLAIVRGNFPRKICSHGYLVEDSRSPIRHKLRFVDAGTDSDLADNGKEVCTDFRLLRAVGGFSLITARPHSGRRHQIRATLFAINFPLLGDKLYARDDRLFQRFVEGKLQAADRKYLAIGRQALHASRLSIRHPNGGRELSFYAPLPDDLKIFLKNPPHETGDAFTES